jgi:sugar/nucleoside kinase (ribokinase family)
MFLHCPGANDTFGAADVDFDLVRRAGHFHLGYPPLMRRLYENDGAELVRVFQGAKQAGATTSLDLSLPDPKSPSGQANWRAILAGVLPYVDVFLPSMEEAFFMLHREEFLARKQRFGGGELLAHITPDECAEMTGEFLAMGAGMVCLKSGFRGYYFRSGDAAAFERMGPVRPGEPQRWANRELWCPAFRPERIASATGSGDSSIAGFLAAFLRGLPLEACLKAANCTGYQNLHALDAVSSIRTWEETRALLRRKPPMIDPALGGKVWRYDAAAEVWIGPRDKR